MRVGTTTQDAGRTHKTLEYVEHQADFAADHTHSFGVAPMHFADADYVSSCFMFMLIRMPWMVHMYKPNEVFTVSAVALLRRTLSDAVYLMVTVARCTADRRVLVCACVESDPLVCL